ncbi:hypothetical protein SAMN04488042_104295 [Shimia aestuarii]|uniref:Uncharacterized protein n=1 Tax=Shimia aestuarii TaxID=254406 RepID=A0A1I4NP43_9RHOB|nr:hypothetical protein SAMN04488042_104295 [Shimia aestuarii]
MLAAHIVGMFGGCWPANSTVKLETWPKASFGAQFNQPSDHRGQGDDPVTAACQTTVGTDPVFPPEDPVWL